MSGDPRDIKALAKELARYKQALHGHLCEYDAADWLACGGNHPAEPCEVCAEADHGKHRHALKVEIERLTAALSAHLVETTGDGRATRKRQSGIRAVKPDAKQKQDTPQSAPSSSTKGGDPIRVESKTNAHVAERADGQCREQAPSLDAVDPHVGDTRG